MKGKLMIIDGSSLLFRGFYAIRHLTTKDGIFTNGVYGFMGMYYRLMDTYNPDYICVAFDRSGPTFRHEDYELYKGTRKDTPPELSGQFGMLKDVLKTLNVSYEEMDGYEADDICGTLAKDAKNQGYESILVTGDRDYLQLVDDGIKVVLTKKGITEVKEYDVETIRDEFQITPLQLIDVKGLMGDASDNIPGVPGVGEKTALKYIKEYGSIEELYENLENIKGKAAKEKLESNKDLAILSKKLGTIFLDVPVDRNIERLQVKEPNVEEAQKIFEILEFNQFLKRLPIEEKQVEMEFEYSFANEDEIEKIVNDIKEAKNFTFHMFYDGESYVYSSPVFMGIKYADSPVYVVEINDDKKGLLSFKEVFESDEITKLSYDIKSDIYYLFGVGINISGKYEDLTVAEYLVDPSKSSYSIEKAARHYLGRELQSKEDIVGKGKKLVSLLDVEKEVLGNYIGMYISVTDNLRDSLLDGLEEKEMTKLYYDVELPLIEVLASMENVGFKVDKDYLQKLGEQFQQELDGLENDIYELAGQQFNINSPKQLGELLFEKLELPIIKKTKTGYSTDMEVLEKLRDKNPVIGRIERFRTLKKLSSTYIEGLIKLVGEDGRIHSTFNQIIAATGRISSTDPNLQNIPVKTEEGRLIRKAFVADGGAVLLDGDYSQIELRVLAHLANDQVMIDSFKQGADIHTKTASEVFHVDFDKVTSLQRSNAKAVNFGIVYGISEYGLSQDLNITREEAKEYIENYLDTYQGIKTYMKDIVKVGKEQGYVDTIMKRRRYIPELQSKNFNIRSFGERVALNTPIQGSAADIIKIAMIDVFRLLEDGGYKSKLILQVHDELIIEAVESEKEELSEKIKEVMEQAVQLSVPMKVDINQGKNWYDSK